MAHHAEHNNNQVGEIPKANTKQIWKTFWILLGITALEFFIALGTDLNYALKATLFILMTFAKAIYIVGDFMHLKHEVKALIWSIVIPCVFIVWLILALLIEGAAILQVR